jgi:molecular chaperone GrpE
MRVAAEFDNFKKRMEREKSKLLKYAGENILRDLLTTLDNLDRAVEQGSAAADDEPKIAVHAARGGTDRKGLVSHFGDGMVSSRWPLLAWLLIR